MRLLKLALALLSLTVPMFAAAPHPNSPLTFTNISVPFFPHGIDPFRGISGDLCCMTDIFGDFNTMGYIQGPGLFNSLIIQPSGAVTSYAWGINRLGVVVGGFCTDGCAQDVGEHGYEFFGTEFGGPIFTQLDYPGALSTTANGINGLGFVVGNYCDNQAACLYNLGDHGFLYTGGGYSAINFPGATLTSALALNDSGTVVGTYTAALQGHAYMMRGGVFTTIDPPGAIYAQATGINNLGEIVGTYLDGSSKQHGFTWVAGVFTTIDAPGSILTNTDGVDDRGDIVGSYELSNGNYVGYSGRP
jgi:probable HAF family extracellular repeat protein